MYARRVGQTHNNNSPAFGAHGFSRTGMTILRVTFKNVSFTPGKLTSLGPFGHYHA